MITSNRKNQHMYAVSTNLQTSLTSARRTAANCQKKNISYSKITLQTLLHLAAFIYYVYEIKWTDMLCICLKSILVICLANCTMVWDSIWSVCFAEWSSFDRWQHFPLPLPPECVTTTNNKTQNACFALLPESEFFRYSLGIPWNLEVFEYWFSGFRHLQRFSAVGRTGRSRFSDFWKYCFRGIWSCFQRI